MSDSPQGPHWWRATDGRWYPPEQFTGPPELRPGGDPAAPAPEQPAQVAQPAQPAQPEPAAVQPAQPEPPSEPAAAATAPTAPPAPNYGRRRALVAVAVLALLIVAAIGIWWVVGRGDGAPDEPAATAGSTSTGPVRVAGTVRVESSVPVSQIAPTNCDEWSQLLRIQILDPTGTQLTEFPPAPTDASEGVESTREEGTKSLACDLEFAANVPAGSGYDVVLLNVRDGGRPTLTEPVEGAEEGEVEVPALRLGYACDDVNGCVLRSTG